MTGIRTLAPAWLLTGGFIIWAVAFVALYGMLSVGCELDWDGRAVAGLPLQRLQLAVLFLLTVAAHLLFLRQAAARRGRSASATDRFVARVSRIGALAGLAASLVTYVWVFLLTECVVSA